jgi:hypothetical protein
MPIEVKRPAPGRLFSRARLQIYAIGRWRVVKLIRAAQGAPLAGAYWPGRLAAHFFGGGVSLVTIETDRRARDIGA